jgi:hypothetical protein
MGVRTRSRGGWGPSHGPVVRATWLAAEATRNVDIVFRDVSDVGPRTRRYAFRRLWILRERYVSMIVECRGGRRQDMGGRCRRARARRFSRAPSRLPAWRLWRLPQVGGRVRIQSSIAVRRIEVKALVQHLIELSGSHPLEVNKQVQVERIVLMDVGEARRVYGWAEERGHGEDYLALSPRRDPRRDSHRCLSTPVTLWGELGVKRSLG